MPYKLHAGASERLHSVSDGTLHLEHDETGVFLVHDGKGVRVQILDIVDKDAAAEEGRFKSIAELSTREQEVFEMLGEGLDMAAIGERMLFLKVSHCRRRRESGFAIPFG